MSKENRDKTPYVALYGNSAIPKAWCYRCECTAFVMDGILQCCDASFSDSFERVKRETDAVAFRRRPSQVDQERILESQDGRCIYCESSFGAIRYRGDRPVKLRLEWDHDIPFAFSHDSSGSNFVAACHVCNALKSDRLFASLDAARVALVELRAKKGYEW